MSASSQVTSHVLDATTGMPAQGVHIRLESIDGAACAVLAEAVTDADGRAGALGPDSLPVGTYRLTFGSGPYFAQFGIPTFYPEVVITFVVDTARHCHVPLLLSPFAYSTYRGS